MSVKGSTTLLTRYIFLKLLDESMIQRVRYSLKNFCHISCVHESFRLFAAHMFKSLEKLQVNANISVLQGSNPNRFYVCNLFSAPPEYKYQPDSCPANTIRMETFQRYKQLEMQKRISSRLLCWTEVSLLHLAGTKIIYLF